METLDHSEQRHLIHLNMGHSAHPSPFQPKQCINKSLFRESLSRLTMSSKPHAAILTHHCVVSPVG